MAQLETDLLQLTDPAREGVERVLAAQEEGKFEGLEVAVEDGIPSFTWLNTGTPPSPSPADGIIPTGADYTPSVNVAAAVRDIANTTSATERTVKFMRTKSRVQEEAKRVRQDIYARLDAQYGVSDLRDEIQRMEAMQVEIHRQHPELQGRPIPLLTKKKQELLTAESRLTQAVAIETQKDQRYSDLQNGLEALATSFTTKQQTFANASIKATALTDAAKTAHMQYTKAEDLETAVLAAQELPGEVQTILSSPSAAVAIPALTNPVLRDAAKARLMAESTRPDDFAVVLDNYISVATNEEAARNAMKELGIPATELIPPTFNQLPEVDKSAILARIAAEVERVRGQVDMKDFLSKKSDSSLAAHISPKRSLTESLRTVFEAEVAKAGDIPAVEAIPLLENLGKQVLSDLRTARDIARTPLGSAMSNQEIINLVTLAKQRTLAVLEAREQVATGDLYGETDGMWLAP